MTLFLSVPKWRTLASSRWRSCLRHLVFKLFLSVEYNSRSSPPSKSIRTESTYSISSMAFFSPMYWCRSPPKLVVILYLPSDRVPAPPNPYIILQGLQPIQWSTLPSVIGQVLFWTFLPPSIIRTFLFVLSFLNS